MNDAQLLQMARERGALIGPTVGELMRAKQDNDATKGKQRYQKRRSDDPYKSDAERTYAAMLAQDQEDGIISRWIYEDIGLRIDDGSGKMCVFWPDFCVWTPDGQLECREIKGRGKFALRPAARVKFLAARRLYPEFVFRCLKAPDWKEIL